MKTTIKITILLILIITSNSIFSQNDKIEYLSNFDKAPISWGFYFGLNKSDYKISYKSPETVANAYVETDPSIGFNVGLIGDLRLHKNVSLRIEPGLFANSKKLYFRHLNNAVDSIRKVSGTYLHVPLLLQLNANRMRNIRPYVIGGVAYDYNFASNFNNPDDNSSGEFRMQKNNFMYEIGIGMDFYFYWFKFSPSIRGVFALNNELKRDDNPNSAWTTPIDYYGTRGVFLQLTFQ
jgi:hypothetical protein